MNFSAWRPFVFFVLAAASTSSLAQTVDAALEGGAPPGAGLQLFHDDEQGWLDSVGDVNEIRFDELGLVQITDQYASEGLVVGEEQFFFAKQSGIYDDGWGAENIDASGALLLEFTQPISAIAFRTPAAPTYRFFRNGEELSWWPPPSGFNGFVTDFEFDSIVMTGLTVYAIDDIFIPVVPAPGTLGVVVLAICSSARRRRHAV